MQSVPLNPNAPLMRISEANVAKDLKETAQVQYVQQNSPYTQYINQKYPDPQIDYATDPQPVAPQEMVADLAPNPQAQIGDVNASFQSQDPNILTMFQKPAEYELTP